MKFEIKVPKEKCIIEVDYTDKEDLRAELLVILQKIDHFREWTNGKARFRTVYTSEKRAGIETHPTAGESRTELLNDPLKERFETINGKFCRIIPSKMNLMEE